MNEQGEVKKAVCMWCHDHCPVDIHIKDGKLIKIEERQNTPRTKTLQPVVRGCPRARAAAEWFHHPDRLNYPLKRTGERGENKWQKITWEQALDEIAEKLASIKEKYGAEAVASTRGTFRSQEEYRRRFLNLFGTPNLMGSEQQLCYGPRNVVSSFIMGWPTNMFRPHPSTKCVLLIGVAPEKSNRGRWFSINMMRKEYDTKLIVIDPRHTEIAQRADIWLQLRPGTDCALLMSMINVIIEEGIYDKEFVEKWCYGFDKLAERAREYPPEKTADITWVPAEKIREAARLYALNKPAVSHSGMGIEELAHNIETLHARFILPAITGNIDVWGGDVLYIHHPTVISEAEIEISDMLPTEQKDKMLASDRFPIYSWRTYELIQGNLKRVWGKQMASNTQAFGHSPTGYRAILSGKPYPIKAVITQASNPLVTQANVKLAYKALKALDLHVVMDFWTTPSAQIADYVLPAASWLERPILYTRFSFGDIVEVGEEALPPQVEGRYDRRTDYDFWRGLGIRLGQADYWPWKDLEDALDYRVEPIGYTVKRLIDELNGSHGVQVDEKKHEKFGFATPTGKVELYSTILEQLGCDPLPKYEEPAESPISSPELAKEYPLILTSGGRVQPYYHSEHRQIDSLRRQSPDPVMQLHPTTAAELGINDGDWVWIETQRGRIRMKCEYFDGIDPRVVHAEHGWWFPEEPGEEPWLHGVWESNINVVTDDDPDHCGKIGGAWPIRGELCKVHKVKTY
jgi:anaerobic selenocysteine-containing dehydrogenase